VDVKALLESAILRRCTLTVGDVVRVRVPAPGGGAGAGERDQEHELLVAEVSPEDAGAVSLIETDLAVDIAPSFDYERTMRDVAEREAARLRDAAAARAAVEDEIEARARDAREAAVRAAEDEEVSARREARAARYREAAAKVRSSSVHWSPYDRVHVVNADP